MNEPKISAQYSDDLITRIPISPFPKRQYEYKAQTVMFREITQSNFGFPSNALDLSGDKIVQAFLDQGWRVSGSITCPPFAMIIFIREKEITE